MDWGWWGGKVICGGNITKLDTKEIGDILNPERELEILECEKEGIEADPLYAHLNPESRRDDDILQPSKWCKTIKLMTREQLEKEAQNLDRFKRITLDIGLKHARNIVKERTNNNDIKTDTPQVIVLGGAGSVKSTVIKTWDQNSFNCRGWSAVSQHSYNSNNWSSKCVDWRNELTLSYRVWF